MIPKFLRLPVTAGSLLDPDLVAAAGRPRWPRLVRHQLQSLPGSQHAPRLRELDMHHVREIEGRVIESAVTRGFRRANEDAHLVAAFNPGAALDTHLALREAFARTDELTRHHHSGSTCTAAVIGANHDITLAHVGDSPAILFVVDGATGEVYFQSLLRDHNGRDEHEQQRVLQSWREHATRNAEALQQEAQCDAAALAKHEVLRQGRIVLPGGSSLALTRAFGDRRFAWALSREPDITHIRLRQWLPDLRPNDRVFLCVASDGLTEVPGLRTELALQGLAGVVREAYLQDQCEGLAEALVRQAYTHSTDNITALVTEIDHRNPPAGGEVLMCLADGHGGMETSQSVVLAIRKCLTAGGMSMDKDAQPDDALINRTRISKRWSAPPQGKTGDGPRAAG